VSLKEEGDFAGARKHVQSLLARADAGDLHRLAGEIDEKLGDPLSAVHEFEKRAQGSQRGELLRMGLRAAPAPRRLAGAGGVPARHASFSKVIEDAHGSGVALFSRALYDERRSAYVTRPT